MSGCMSAFSGMPAVEFCDGINQLIEEHRLLSEKLDGLFLLTEKIAKEVDMASNFTELKNKVAAFKKILDPHSDREEMVLFPMLGVYIGTSTGPIAVMECDHDQAKGYIRTFLEKSGLEQPSLEEMKNSSDLVKNAYEILTEHFAKEENVLFPMAERMLSAEEKAEFYQKIQQIN